MLVFWTCVFLNKRKVKLKVRENNRETNFQRKFKGFGESPGDESRDNESGIGVTVPEHPSVELLPQMSGLPTILQTNSQKRSIR